MQETQVRSPSQQNSAGGGNGNQLHNSAWRIPRTEEPGGLHPWSSKESDKTERLACTHLKPLIQVGDTRHQVLSWAFSQNVTLKLLSVYCSTYETNITDSKSPMVKDSNSSHPLHSQSHFLERSVLAGSHFSFNGSLFLSYKVYYITTFSSSNTDVQFKRKRFKSHSSTSTASQSLLKKCSCTIDFNL